MTPTPQDQVLEWESARRMTLDAARRRSGVVKLLRLTFILAAVLIVGVVIAYIIVSAQKPAPIPEPEPIVTQEPTENEVVITKPRFTGTDDAGRPYVVIAETAARRPGSEDVTDLVGPQLDTDPDRDDNSRVTAQRGVYDAKNRILDLFEQVELGTPNGYIYATNHAKFLIGEDRIIGDEPVSGEGPMGKIAADSYEIANGGKIVYFRGNVKTRIHDAEGIQGDEK